MATKSYPKDRTALLFIDPYNDFLSEHVERYVSRAKFLGSYADDPDRLNVLLSSDEFDDCRDAEEWSYLASHYPKTPVVADSLTKFENEDIPVRAYYLNKAILRLLELIGAPEAMQSDLRLFLTEHTPKKIAEKYGDIQRAMIEDPYASVPKIAKDAGANRATVYDVIKRNIVVVPER